MTTRTPEARLAHVTLCARLPVQLARRHPSRLATQVFRQAGTIGSDGGPATHGGPRRRTTGSLGAVALSASADAESRSRAAIGPECWLGLRAETVLGRLRVHARGQAAAGTAARDLGPGQAGGDRRGL